MIITDKLLVFYSTSSIIIRDRITLQFKQIIRRTNVNDYITSLIVL